MIAFIIDVVIPRTRTTTVKLHSPTSFAAVSQYYKKGWVVSIHVWVKYASVGFNEP